MAVPKCVSPVRDLSHWVAALRHAAALDVPRLLMDVRFPPLGSGRRDPVAIGLTARRAEGTHGRSKLATTLIVTAMTAMPKM